MACETDDTKGEATAIWVVIIILGGLIWLLPMPYMLIPAVVLVFAIFAFVHNPRNDESILSGQYDPMNSMKKEI